MIFKIIFLALFSFVFQVSFAQSNKNWQEVNNILAVQEKAWNEGNIDAFMQGYWKNDSLKFVSNKGVVYGWQNTYERYKKNYPDRATMGILKFELVSKEQMGKEVYFVVGKWFLKREEKGDIGGYFTLIFRKIKGKWYIVADHTS
jgi:ketosteroid isomerase-like protein